MNVENKRTYVIIRYFANKNKRFIHFDEFVLFCNLQHLRH